jgi:DNA-binding MarR family transcriptional regulator
MKDNREKLVNEIIEDMGSVRRSVFARPKHPEGFRPIPPAQGELLHIVAAHKALTVKEIAGIMRITGSAVTQLADPLVKAGFVTRKHDEQDRRVVRISLSAKGQTKVATFHKHLKQHFTEMVEPLSVKELQIYRDLNRKIIANLKNK